MAPKELTLRDRLRGTLLGTAVGDALGLPAEGLSRRRANRLFGGRWRHRFLLGRGMVSDDTEHTLFVAQSLLASPNSPQHFARRLAWCLRGWLLTLPAGVGLATLRACLRLWIGISPDKSGVWSAGNGPAMRAAPIGVFFAGEGWRAEPFLVASTRLTHRDPKALTAATAVANLAGWSVREGLGTPPSSETLCGLLEAAGPRDGEWSELVRAIARARARNISVLDFAAELGLSKGVSGYAYDTVPVAVYAWVQHFGDFRTTLTSVLDCGGDTDTTGAIVGGLAGASVGERGIPRGWIDGIIDWPRGTQTLRAVADALAERGPDSGPGKPIRYFWPALPIRNVIFLAVVLVHGLRRLAPPY